MTLDTILVAVGTTDDTRTTALVDAIHEIAAPTDATVVLAHVFTEKEYENAVSELDAELTTPSTDPDTTTSRRDPPADEVAGHRPTVRDLQTALTDVGLTTTIRSAIGPHGDTIATLAEAEAADRVIVGGRQRTPAGKAVFGSTAQQILLSAPCPITFVRTDLDTDHAAPDHE